MADHNPIFTRGQSEVLGFIFVFATVITAVAIVSTTGFAGLQAVQQAEEANNAERAFEILDDNVDDLVTGRAPHRGTEVKLADAELALGDPVNVTVSGEQTTDPSQNFSYTYDIRPLEYEVGDTTLIYAGGAIIRQDRAGMVMIREPAFVFSDRELVLPIVQTRPGETTAVGGSHTVNVRTSLAETSLLVVETEPYHVEYEVTSDQADAWEAYFESTGADNVTRTDSDTVRAEIDTDRVYVTVVRIDVTFE